MRALRFKITFHDNKSNRLLHLQAVTLALPYTQTILLTEPNQALPSSHAYTTNTSFELLHVTQPLMNASPTSLKGPPKLFIFSHNPPYLNKSCIYCMITKHVISFPQSGTNVLLTTYFVWFASFQQFVQPVAMHFKASCKLMELMLSVVP